MSERVGIHLSTDEWIETETNNWLDLSTRVKHAYSTGDALVMGDDVLNPFHVVSVRRGGIPMDPEQTT